MFILNFYLDLGLQICEIVTSDESKSTIFAWKMAQGAKGKV
jgi:hypothetical protein